MSVKRVALAGDRDSWAWHHVAKGLAKYAPADCEVTLFRDGEFPIDDARRCDGVLFLSCYDGADRQHAGRVMPAAVGVMMLAPSQPWLGRQPADHLGSGTAA